MARYWYARTGDKPEWLRGPMPIKGTPGFLVHMLGVLGMVLSTTTITPLVTNALFGWGAGSAVVALAMGLPGLLLVGFWLWASKAKCAPENAYTYDATGTFVVRGENQQ